LRLSIIWSRNLSPVPPVVNVTPAVVVMVAVMLLA